MGEDDLSTLVNIAVGKGKGKRGRSTNNGSGWGVLGSVAWALEFVGGGRPWDNTSQVSAHSVESVALKCLVFLDDQVAVKRGENIEPVSGQDFQLDRTAFE